MTHRLVAVACLALFLAALTIACSGSDGAAHAADGESVMAAGIPASATEGENGVALFAGGCFWCIESVFDTHPGVLSAVSGYAGGPEESPTYRQVGYGRTGHTETVRVVFDPKRVSYAELIEVFWHNIDPFQRDGQFCDRGTQYRSEVFFADEAQQKVADETKSAVEAKFGRTAATSVTPASVFWPAEDHHQDFHETNPVRYLSYRAGCGRDRRLAELWGKQSAH